MPLHWTIDSEFQFLSVIARGDVVRLDVEGLLDAMASQGAMSYRKLFDGLDGTTDMGLHDLLGLGARMRAFHALGPMGPLALVLPDDKADSILPLLGMLAAADRPMRIFNDHKKARRWLASFGGALPRLPPRGKDASPPEK
jgi:hypothetical protein